MKKIYLQTLPLFILLFSCNSKPNYDVISEMNNIAPIEIVYIDEKTINEIGSFPIDRKYYAQAIEQIEKGNPKYIILKFFFDTTSSSDIALSEVLKKYGNILTQTTIHTDTTCSKSIVENLKISLNQYTNSSMDSIHLLLPNDVLINDFIGIGHVDFLIRNSKSITLPIIEQIDGVVIPSLALKIGMLISNMDPIISDEMVILGESEILLERKMLKLKISKPGFYKSLSFIDVLKSEVETGEFHNKVIIIFVDFESVRNVQTVYDSPHNYAEIVADSINTVLINMK